jgi:hypothetical protein
MLRFQHLFVNEEILIYKMQTQSTGFQDEELAYVQICTPYVRKRYQVSVVPIGKNAHISGFYGEFEWLGEFVQILLSKSTCGVKSVFT